MLINDGICYTLIDKTGGASSFVMAGPLLCLSVSKYTLGHFSPRIWRCRYEEMIASVLSLLLIFSMVSCSDHSSEKERPFVNGATAATFEYIEDIDKGQKVITSEVSSLYTFDDLDLIPSNDASTFNWIYRIVFNPAETVKDGKEITVLFGVETVSINEINYNAADETDYSDILE
ncbi:MAG: hypothetical protein LUD83_02885 [Clostridiales bacterium]|nr:hypothetical protein [Clostridiales bacterium]